MDSFTLSAVIDYFVEVCKYFKARYNDDNISLQIPEGLRIVLPYDKFINVYLSSFIQTMMTDDEGGEK